MIAHTTVLFETAYDPTICMARFARNEYPSQHWPAHLYKGNTKVSTAEFAVCRFCNLPIERSEAHRASSNGWITSEYVITEEP